MSATPIISLMALTASEDEAVKRLQSAGATSSDNAQAVSRDDAQYLQRAIKEGLVGRTGHDTYFVDQARYAAWIAASERAPRFPRNVMIGLMISGFALLAVVVVLFARAEG